MKYNRLYIGLWIFCWLAPMWAGAGVLIEPYFGGGAAYSRMTAGDSVTTAPKHFTTTLALGGRLGYEVLKLKGGLDVFYNRFHTGSGFSMPSVVVNNPGVSKGFRQAGDSVSIKYASTSENFNPLSVGLFGALDLPFILDIYSSLYYSFGKRNARSYSGPGVKVGVSWMSFFFVQFHLEMGWTHYFCKGSECLQTGFNMMSALLMVSFPFSMDLLGAGGAVSESSAPDENIMEENIMEDTAAITEQL